MGLVVVKTERGVGEEVVKREEGASDIFFSRSTVCPIYVCAIAIASYADVMALYLSCPAVSQICALMIFPSTWMLLVANSTPMVDLDSRLNSLRVKRESKLLLPTPESPIRTTTENRKKL